jgi:hypothetical protein
MQGYHRHFTPHSSLPYSTLHPTSLDIEVQKKKREFGSQGHGGLSFPLNIRECIKYPTLADRPETSYQRWLRLPSARTPHIAAPLQW